MIRLCLRLVHEVAYATPLLPPEMMVKIVTSVTGVNEAAALAVEALGGVSWLDPPVHGAGSK